MSVFGAGYQSKTTDRSPASTTILPLLRLLTKISPSHHSCKADSHTKSNGSTTPRDTNRNQPIRTDLTKQDIPSYTNSRQNSAQDLDHGVNTVNRSAYQTCDETHLPTAAHLLLIVQLSVSGDPAGFHSNGHLIIIPTTYSPTSSIHSLTTRDGGKN